MQAYSMPFSTVINIDQGARDHFHVPRYQREYAWRRKEWEQLLNDIDENDPGYGGVAICVGIEFGAISRVTILPPHAARSMI